MNTLLFIIVGLVLAGMLYHLLDSILVGSTEIIEQECDCGKYDKCISKVTIHSGTYGTGLSRKSSELLQCGKVQKQIEQIHKMFEEKKDE